MPRLASVAEGVSGEEVEDVLLQSESGGACVQSDATKTQGVRETVVQFSVHSGRDER